MLCHKVSNKMYCYPNVMFNGKTHLNINGLISGLNTFFYSNEIYNSINYINNIIYNLPQGINLFTLDLVSSIDKCNLYYNYNNIIYKIEIKINNVDIYKSVDYYNPILKKWILHTLHHKISM